MDSRTHRIDIDAMMAHAKAKWAALEANAANDDERAVCRTQFTQIEMLRFMYGEMNDGKSSVETGITMIEAISAMIANFLVTMPPSMRDSAKHSMLNGLRQMLDRTLEVAEEAEAALRTDGADERRTVAVEDFIHRQQ